LQVRGGKELHQPGCRAVRTSSAKVVSCGVPVYFRARWGEFPEKYSRESGIFCTLLPCLRDIWVERPLTRRRQFMTRSELEAIVKLHQAETYRYLRYLGADNAIAEDLVQETFMAVFRSSSQPDAQNTRRTAAWVRGIARNLFLRYCRSKRSNPVKTSAKFLETAEEFWASQFLKTGDGLDYLAALRKCLELLPAKRRRILDLRYREGRSRSELAQTCSMTENGIKSLLRRIRLSLADCVRKRLEPERT